MHHPTAGDPADGGFAADRRRFFRNTRFSIGQQAVTVVLAVLLVPFMLWRLGTEGYGIWLTLQIFNIAGLIALAELGFQGAIVRTLVRHHARGDAGAFRSLMITSFALFAGIGALCGAVVAAFAWAGFVDLFRIPPSRADETRWALSVYAGGLLLSFPLLILKAFFAGTQDIATLKVWETLDRVAFAAVITVLLSVTTNLAVIALVEQATLLLVGLAFAVRARRTQRAWFSINPNWASRRSLDGVLSLSGLVLITNLTNHLFVKGPEAVVGAILGPSAVAQYSVASRIPRVLKTAQGALNAVVMPFVAKLDMTSEGREAKRRFALRGLRTSYLLFIPPSCFLIVFADHILSAWVGSKFASLGGFLAAAVLVQLLMIITAFGSATYTRHRHFHAAVWGYAAVSAVFIPLSLWALGRFGLWGAFVALGVCGTAMAAVSLNATARANGFGARAFLAVVAKPALLAGGAGLACFAGARAAFEAAGQGLGLLALFAASAAYVVFLHAAVLDSAERSAVRGLLVKARARP